MKRDLKYRGHVYLELVRPHIIYQVLTFLKSHNKFYKDISVTKDLSGEDMLNFPDINKNQEETESVTENGISHGKEINKNNNENASEAEYASVEDPLNMHRTATNETPLISEIPNIINEENAIIVQGQGKSPVSSSGDRFCEEQTFPYLLLKVKFGYSVPRDIPISPTRHFNQRLLYFNQHFASDADYIFFARSVHEQHHLRSSINFAMNKTKPDTLTAGTVKNNFKRTIERFVASDNGFSFMSSVKETPAYWKQFVYDVFAMVKQLGIPTYFLTVMC